MYPFDDEQLIFNLDFDFLNSDEDDRAVIVRKPLYCEKCKEFYPYAESNRPNGILT